MNWTGNENLGLMTLEVGPFTVYASKHRYTIHGTSTNLFTDNKNVGGIYAKGKPQYKGWIFCRDAAEKHVIKILEGLAKEVRKLNEKLD